MKHWYLIPLAALLGLAAGNLGPRTELESVRAEVAEAKASAEKAAKSGGFDAFAKMANIPERAKHRHRQQEVEVEEPSEETDLPRQGEEIEAPAEEVAKEDQPEWKAPEDLEARIDEAAELWRTRIAIAKSQWKARLGIGENMADRFDAEIDAMNDSLRETMSALAQAIAEKGRMTPELGLRMVGDATAVMAETYDRIGAIVPEANVDDVSEMQVFEFIDPSVAEPLIQVQDLMK